MTERQCARRKAHFKKRLPKRAVYAYTKVMHFTVSSGIDRCLSMPDLRCKILTFVVASVLLYYVRFVVACVLCETIVCVPLADIPSVVLASV